MYAVVESGSKQYRVRKGDVIHVELIGAEPGQEVNLGSVLLVSDEEGQVQVGAPTVAGYVVKAECLAEVKGEKITSMKYKQRKNERRKFGHRQRYSQLRILDISNAV
jgi:large subunit ribosomal protein L21